MQRPVPGAAASAIAMQIGAPLTGHVSKLPSYHAACNLMRSYSMGPSSILSFMRPELVRRTAIDSWAYCNSSRNGSSAPTRAKAGEFKLIIYSKPDCPLCDGLKEKVSGLLQRADFQPSLLSGAKLEMRDITRNPEWEAAYSIAIPVLSHAALDGSHERRIPRPAPRISADRLERHIVEALGGNS